MCWNRGGLVVYFDFPIAKVKIQLDSHLACFKLSICVPLLYLNATMARICCIYRLFVC